MTAMDDAIHKFRAAAAVHRVAVMMANDASDSLEAARKALDDAEGAMFDARQEMVDIIAAATEPPQNAYTTTMPGHRVNLGGVAFAGPPPPPLPDPKYTDTNAYCP